MRNWRLSLLRHITSSRQSPKRSAVREGVDLVPLLDSHPAAVSRVAPPALWIRLASTNSRSRSPSHHPRKFEEPVPTVTGWPAAFRTPPDGPQNSAPGLDSRMSAA